MTVILEDHKIVTTRPLRGGDSGATPGEENCAKVWKDSVPSRRKDKCKGPEGNDHGSMEKMEGYGCSES